MAVHLQRTVQVSLKVAVSRAAPGDLADGVQQRLCRLDGVERVEALTLDGIEPGLNDLTAEVSASLTLAADLAETLERGGPAAVEDRLSTAFGVSAVCVRTMNAGED